MWDDRIDEAARELTQGSPASDFKARVLERIEREGTGTDASSWKRWLVWMTPIAAAAAVFVVMMQDRDTPEAPVPSTQVATRISEPAATPPAPTRAPAPSLSSRRSPAQSSTVSEFEVPIPLELLPGDVEAIVFKPLTTAPIDIAAVDPGDPVIPPLTLDAIDIPALSQ